MLTEKTRMLSLLDDEITNLLEDEGALAGDIEEADEYKQNTIVKVITPALPTAPAAHAHTSPRSDPLPMDAAC